MGTQGTENPRAFRPGSVNWKKSWIALALTALMLASGCSLPSVSAESRIFLPLSLEYLGAQTLPKTDATGVPLEAITAVTYDRGRDRIYAVTKHTTPPSLITLNLALDLHPQAIPSIQAITPESITPLPVSADEVTTPTLTGLALTGQTLWSTRQAASTAAMPITALRLPEGGLQQTLPLPKRLIPPQADASDTVSDVPSGLKAITLDFEGQRLFTATEYPWAAATPEPLEHTSPYSRFFHYWIGEPQPYLLAEHLYPLADPQSSHLDALTTLDGGGHFLSLERSQNPQRGDQVQIFQLATGDATDVSGYAQVPESVVPIRKQLLLTLPTVDRLTGANWSMTLGPNLPDGNRTLIVSNSNTETGGATQFMLLRLHPQPSPQPSV